MKRIIIALCLMAIGIVFTTAALAQSDYIKSELTDATYGLHLMSDHANNNGTNNGNLGVYIRTKSGWTAGHYHNSCDTYTNYYGWTSLEWYRIRISPVIASGYHCLSGKVGLTEGPRWSTALVPTVRVYTWAGEGSEVSLRAMVVPGLVHLMLEGMFK